jgi:hypothetical protein
MPSAHAGPPLLDFSIPEVVRAFQVANDGVMGGVSTSRPAYNAGLSCDICSPSRPQ